MSEPELGPGPMTVDMVYELPPDQIRGCLGCGLAYIAGSEELHDVVHAVLDRAIREGWVDVSAL